jgi:hypothetical protein
MNISPVQTVEITLKNGIIATIELTPQLVKSVKEAYTLGAHEEISPNHVKLYLIKAMQNALEKS